jgi:DNA-binding NarL/FixJ family response regulator
MRGVVQERQQLLREGIALALGAEPDLEIVATVAAPSGLLEVVEQHAPLDFAVVELGGDAVPPLLRGVRVVAVASRSTLGPRPVGVAAVVCRGDGLAGLVAAIRARGESPVRRLTPREIEVLVSVAGGHPAHEIGRRLQISPKTVDNHKQRIYAKLGAQNQAHAVAVATRAGLIGAGAREWSAERVG